jgi:MerR family copper efflux transcriptional regulator
MIQALSWAVMPALTVSKLADQVGMTPDALRYYERTGLLPKAERTASGYRLYNEETAARLRFIKGA